MKKKKRITFRYPPRGSQSGAKSNLIKRNLLKWNSQIDIKDEWDCQLQLILLPLFSSLVLRLRELKLFSMVMHDAVSILLILPHRLRCDLNVASILRPKSFRRNVWNPQLVAVWNLALASMESMPIALYGIKTEGRGDTRQAAMPYAGGRFHAIREAN